MWLNKKKEFVKMYPMIDFIFGPDNIDQLPEIVGNLNQQGGSKIVQAKFDHVSLSGGDLSA